MYTITVRYTEALKKSFYLDTWCQIKLKEHAIGQICQFYKGQQILSKIFRVKHVLLDDILEVTICGFQSWLFVKSKG